MIVLHIDKLVLRGVEPHQADAIAKGIRHELTRQLTKGSREAQENMSQIDHRQRINVGKLVTGAARGEQLGSLVASKIAGNLRQ